MWWGHGWGWGGWLAMSLMMLAFWGVLVWVLVTLIRSRNRDPNPARRQPEDVLAERFARSEIDEAEYRYRLSVLRGASGSGPVHPDTTDRSRAAS